MTTSRASRPGPLCLVTLLTLLLVSARCGHGSVSGRAGGRPVSASELSIEARIEQKLPGLFPHPVVVVEFTNTAEQAVAFSETFGFGASWIALRIRTEEGAAIGYPVEADLFHRPPYRCLAPGETLSWRIDPLDWRLQEGGHSGEERFGFPLPPGRYEVQVRYSGAGRRFGCRPLRGVARSEWISLTIP